MRCPTVFRISVTAASLTCALFSQPPKQQAPAKGVAKSMQAQSSSSINSTTDANGSEVVEIHNVAYEVTGTDVPGRLGERLLLRKTVHSKETLGDIGINATITLEAWRFGDDVRQKPLYAITASGSDGHTLDNAIFVAERGLEDAKQRQQRSFRPLLQTRRVMRPSLVEIPVERSLVRPCAVFHVQDGFMLTAIANDRRQVKILHR